MGKITAYGSLAAPAPDDVLLIVDVHDTSMASTGTDKKITAAALLTTTTVAPPTGVAATDTVNINAAITTWITLGRGILQFQEGLYVTNGGHLVGGGSPGAGVIKGTGWNSEIQLANGANTYIFDFGSAGSPQYTPGLRMSDLYLNCNGANQTSGSGGIYARGAVWCAFEHLWIDTPQEAGIRFYQDGLGGYGHHNTVQNCKISSTGAAITNQYGIWLDHSDENMISNNTIQQIGNPATQTYPTGIYDVSGLQTITGNQDVTGTGIYTGGAGGRTRIVNNIMDGSYSASGQIYVGSAGALVANNFCYNIGYGQATNTGDGIFLDNTDHLTCTGNTCFPYTSTVARSGIHLNGSVADSLVTSNTVFPTGGGTFTSPIKIDSPSGSTSTHISDNMLGAATDGPAQVNAVSYGADPSGSADSYAAITAALGALPAAGGTVILPPGTIKTNSTITMTNNQRLIGAGVGATVLTTASDITLIQMGNEQSDHVMRNWMMLADMTVNQTGGTQTHANVKIDGGGRGTSIQRVSTGGGKYGFELIDLDRCYFCDISANNPSTAGIFLEVGWQNTYGTTTFVNCDAVLSNSSTYGFYVGHTAAQTTPNQPDRLTFIGCMMFMTGGLTGCVGFYDTVGMTSATFTGCLWEQNSRQFRTDGTGSTVSFLGCTFLDSNNAATDIAYLNGSGSFTFRDCRFQQATNCFNAVSGSPSLRLEGKNNNQGNLTNLFVGTWTSKMGDDTVFAGSGTLALGLNSQPFDYLFVNHLVQNAGSNTSGSAPAITPSFSQGVASQLSDLTRDYQVYLQFGAAGTAMSVAIGPTSTPANTIISSAAVTAGEVITFRLPAGWYAQVSFSTTTLAHQSAVGC